MDSVLKTYNLFPQIKTSEENICLDCIFIPSWKCISMQSSASSLPINCHLFTFTICCCS